MATASSLVHTEQFEEIASNGERCELVQGVVYMMSPAGGRHGLVTGQILVLLFGHVRKNRLGVVLSSETGFIIGQNPDTVRAPDIAFVKQERWDSLEDTLGFVPLAPDLAIEVTSPTDRIRDIESKIKNWLASGCHCVLQVEPDDQTVVVHQNQNLPQSFSLDQTIDLDFCVPGWKPSVVDFFR